MKGGEKLLEQAAAAPDDEFFQARLAEAPKQEHDFYWEQFWVVNTERIDGGSIPVSRLWQTAREMTEDVAEQCAFVFIMRVMDKTFLQIIAEKNKAGSK
jgi:hypothetical protein